MDRNSIDTRRICIQTLFPKWMVARHHTDHLYHVDLFGIARYYNIEFLLSGNINVVTKRNIGHIANSLMSRLSMMQGIQGSKLWQRYRRSVGGRLANINADIIYSNFLVPRKSQHVPFVLEADFTPYGSHSKQREYIKERLWIPKKGIDRCDVIIVRSRKSYDDFYDLYPDYKGIVEIVPFYMPYIESGSATDLANKWNNTKCMQILFVGNQARRKGLPNFVDAVTSLKRSGLKFEVEVISNFLDGDVATPKWIKVSRGVGRDYVVSRMRESHVVALPSFSDAYPKVCYEAIAAQCALLVPNWSPMVDMWASCGVAVDITRPASIAMGLEQLIGDRDTSRDIAYKNLSLYDKQYAPSIVARRYYDIFSQLC